MFTVIQRSGISGSYYEAHTGAEDIEKLGIIESVDGVDHLEAWGDTECGRVQGTAGAMFPPHLVQQKKSLYFFTKDLCRRLPLVFKEDLMVMYSYKFSLILDLSLKT